MTTSESKGRFFYKTNRFESIRMTNRIDRELECSITYDGEAMWRRHRDRDVKGVDGQWTQSKSSAMRDPGSTTHGPNGGRKENMHKVVYSFSRNTVLTSHND